MSKTKNLLKDKKFVCLEEKERKEIEELNNLAAAQEVYVNE